MSTRAPEAVVTSSATLRRMASDEGAALWLRDTSGVPPLGTVQVRIGQYEFLISPDDGLGSRVVVLRLCQDGSLLGPDAGEREYRPVVERLSLFTERARSTHVQLPHAWAVWHEGDRFAFGAAAYNQNPRAVRCIAHVDSFERSVLIWDFYLRKRSVRLESVEIDEQVLRGGVGRWHRAVEEAQRLFEQQAQEEPSSRRHVLIDATPPGSAVEAFTFEQWESRLTARQRSFVESDAPHGVNLKGPAGSGKTLALEMKALREVYREAEKGEASHVLFATHSWASADQVDRDLHRLDTRGLADHVEVMPLSMLAESLTPTGSWRPDGMDLLGDDSHSSKLLQLDIIDSVVSDFVEKNWITFRDKSSEGLRRRIDGRDADTFFNQDLLIEFGCVLAAENIFRSRDAEQRYLDLWRGQWMMPLETEGDRRVVFELYQKYLNELRANSLVTTDLLMSEFFRFLQGNVWDVRREIDGYNLVLVDEVHLFNVQERMALRSLMRDPRSYARICAAMDLRQSPRVRSRPAESEEGDPDSIELDSVHRYSPEILGFVRHVHDSYPILGLGDEWALDLDRVESTAEHGPKPVLHVISGSRESAMNGALARANSLREQGQQTAVLVLDERYFGEYLTFAERTTTPTVIVAGRDDLLTLQHTKRAVVIGLPEHVAGLQFDNVILVELPEGLGSDEAPAYRQRDIFTLLYLASSRARSRLEIFAEGESPIPSVLSEAVRQGMVAQVNA